MTSDELDQAGNELARLLVDGDFDQIASRFGYALCFDKSPRQAIEDDFSRALHEVPGCIVEEEFNVSTCFFNENDVGLVAEVICKLPVEAGGGVLAELILNSSGCLYLEEVSSYRERLDA